MKLSKTSAEIRKVSWVFKLKTEEIKISLDKIVFIERSDKYEELAIL